VRVPILVFGALSVSDLEGVFEFGLTPTISSPSAAKAVQAAAAARGTTAGYHLKIDTGMNRLGFRHDNLRRTLPELLASDNLRLDAVYTHFASADVPESDLFDQQRQNYESALATVDDLLCHGIPQQSAVGRALSASPGGPGLSTSSGSSRAQSRDGNARPTTYLRHTANSAATLRDSRVWYDVVRPGLLLYGIVPPPLASTIALTPVMTLGSRIVAVKGVRPGEGVGYGIRFTAEHPTTIAIVPAGYADGLDMRLEGRGAVLIRGVRAPIVGSVCMDMLMADVTGLDVSPGDEVVIIGSQKAPSGEVERIDVREMAAAIGTIPYEILCRIGSRIERVYE
jgi:alanine racemase